MLKRLFVGLFVGALIGALIAAGAVRGLGLISWPPVLAYVSAAITGMLVGLIAGKPIWASGGQIEAGLKAVFGGIVGAGLMFILRKWVPGTVDLSSLGAGSGALGDLPATSLPLLGAALGAFYEVDNTGDAEAKSNDKKVRVASTNGVGDDLEESGEEEASPARRMRR